MRTNLDPDDECFIPEIDVSTVEWHPNPFARKPGEKSEILIDGAIAYQLRLIPSNKVLARFDSTLEAWSAIIETIEGGRSPRTLALDAVFTDGSVGLMSAGPHLEGWARHSNGEPRPYSSSSRRSLAKRVAEGASI